ncbi:MAG TPA: exopolyphosphatase [Arenicellales bacterium]|nr:exopolyphosphatase [Arenicellales bacterium]
MPAPGPRTPAVSARPETIAAVDLGSNSFHLVVARPRGGELVVVDRLRESVRLGAGLDADKLLSEQAQADALACLERFGQRLRNLPRGSVRAVGTNTLRQARNAGQFLERAEAVLGHPIEVIAGREEARLIYLGVAHDLDARDENRLVVDIGGGSTELIAGRGFEIHQRESLHVGCVGLTRQFFANGRIKKKRLRQAELEAELTLQPVSHLFRRAPRDRAIGCSGTVRSIRAVCQQQGWCEQGITRSAMERLRQYFYTVSHFDELNLRGLAEDRRHILVGGALVLWAVFDLLDLERMDVSDQALREGLLYDLIGRIERTDVRQRSIDGIADRWSVDMEHARRVENAAVAFFERLAPGWGLDGEEHLDMLRWAARIHEIGLLISHGQYHKHGAYVASNADLAGFSRNDQRILATLIRGHRRKFPLSAFEQLAATSRPAALRLCVVLRLAVLMQRGREDILPGHYRLGAENNRIVLGLPAAWIEAHPLTWADLEQEQRYLRAAGIELVLERI